MERTVTPERHLRQDSSTLVARPKLPAAQIPPPGDQLEILLVRLAPATALTWRTLPAALPWTRPPGGGTGRDRPNDDVLAEALLAAGVKHPVARACILSGPYTELMISSPRELARNHGRPARAVEVAAAHDISGRKLADLASWLDLTDHLPAQLRSVGTREGDPRGGRRYLQTGRHILAGLGVWPWAHVEEWGRTRDWWRDPLVHQALISWHDKAWTHALHELAGNALARHGHLARWTSIEEWQACHDFRSRLVDIANAYADDPVDPRNPDLESSKARRLALDAGANTSAHRPS